MKMYKMKQQYICINMSKNNAVGIFSVSKVLPNILIISKSTIRSMWTSKRGWQIFMTIIKTLFPLIIHLMIIPCYQRHTFSNVLTIMHSLCLERFQTWGYFLKHLWIIFFFDYEICTLVCVCIHKEKNLYQLIFLLMAKSLIFQTSKCPIWSFFCQKISKK